MHNPRACMCAIVIYKQDNMYKAIQCTGAVSMRFQSTALQRDLQPGMLLIRTSWYLYMLYFFSLLHYRPCRRLVRLLHGLAQIKCQVRFVTVSAVDFVDGEKGLH